MVTTDPANVLDGIHELVEMLSNSSIDGFVLDHYELVLFFEYFQNDATYRHDVQYIKEKTILTQIQKEESYCYGILVKLEEDFQFLADFLSSNSDVLNTCTRLFLTRSIHKWVNHEKDALFSSKGEMFWQSFVACALLIMICLSFGGVYELRRKIVGHGTFGRKVSKIFQELSLREADNFWR